MNVSMIVGAVIIVVILALEFVPAFQNYKMMYIEKVGYWDILIQFLVIAGINLYTYLNYGLGALFLLIVPIPLDIIYLFLIINSYFQVKKYKQKN